MRPASIASSTRPSFSKTTPSFVDECIGERRVDPHMMGPDTDDLPGVFELPVRVAGGRDPDIRTRFHEPEHRTGIGAVRRNFGGHPVVAGYFDIGKKAFVSPGQAAGDERVWEFHVTGNL